MNNIHDLKEGACYNVLVYAVGPLYSITFYENTPFITAPPVGIVVFLHNCTGYNS